MHRRKANGPKGWVRGDETPTAPPAGLSEDTPGGEDTPGDGREDAPPPPPLGESGDTGQKPRRARKSKEELAARQVYRNAVRNWTFMMIGACNAMPQSEKEAYADWVEANVDFEKDIREHDWPGWARYIGRHPRLSDVYPPRESGPDDEEPDDEEHSDLDRLAYSKGLIVGHWVI